MGCWPISFFIFVNGFLANFLTTLVFEIINGFYHCQNLIICFFFFFSISFSFFPFIENLIYLTPLQGCQVDGLTAPTHNALGSTYKSHFGQRLTLTMWFF